VIAGVGISAGLLLMATTLKSCAAPPPEVMPVRLIVGNPVGPAIETVGAEE